MNFKKTNNITGWAVFAIAFLVYFFSREARGSLWDCGEFVACADQLGMPHSPGAPMFVLLGRFFIILFGDNGATAANAVNTMSALASAATILFLFWSITHFARKMFVSVGEELTGQQRFTVMAAGAVGALAYTFSDSFWFSAGEGEVYALSSFFTALVFWLMLKWEHADEKAGTDTGARARADRWIVLLFFMMGLSIGVHLLNLLTIPAIIMIYFFRRNYKHEESKVEFGRLKKDVFLLSVLGGTIFLSVMLGLSGKSANAMDEGGSDSAKFIYIIAGLGILLFLAKLYLSYKELRKVATALILGAVVTLIVQYGVIQYSMKAAGQFDIFFVNSMHMPFFSGFAIYFVLLAAVIAIAIRLRESQLNKAAMIAWFAVFLFLSALPSIIVPGKGVQILALFFIMVAAGAAGYFLKPSGLRVIKLSLWCYAFMMLGYFMYFTSMIRSTANPGIDMVNVDNPISLVYYLSREQYGQAPLVYGPHYAAKVPDDLDENKRINTGEMQYVKGYVDGKPRYIPIGTKDEYNWSSNVKQLFPRVWDGTNDQNHADFYADWLNIWDVVDQQTGQRTHKAPTYTDNLRWFFTYQMSYMYWRYFMWNFAGKQNDVQGINSNVMFGNWKSGVPFMDNTRLGDQSKLPEALKNNKANNNLYMLPFVLGIIGLVYQFLRNKRDAIVTFLLFFMTGIAIVLYLNQPGNQPRERDYAYVGSFYAYAIWIGLGLVALVKMAQQWDNKKLFMEVMIYGSVVTFIITAMSCLPADRKTVFITSLIAAAIYAVFTGGVTLLLQAISSQGRDLKKINIAAAAICLLIPVLMGQQEWDDHNRSHKTTAPDLAKDYLESCAPNAVIFTFGDNDTYPLWYAQEVEGVRQDIRIINNSLLGIDWYINQLRYQVNKADSLDVMFTADEIVGDKLARIYYSPDPKIDASRYYPLQDVIAYVKGLANKKDDEGGAQTYPINKISLAIDADAVRKSGTVNPDDSIVSEMRFDIPKSSLDRSDLVIFSIIASNAKNGWKRPIYFSSEFGSIGFGQYLRKDGLAYRLVPVLPKGQPAGWITEQVIRETKSGLSTQLGEDNLDVMYKNLHEKYEFGGAGRKGVYFDEENRRHILDMREIFAEAAGNLADQGKKDEALRLLDKVEKGIDTTNIPYAMPSRFYGSTHNQASLMLLEAYYKAGKKDVADRIRKALRKDMMEEQAYYMYVRGITSDDGYGLGLQETLNNIYLRVLDELEKKYAPETLPAAPKPAETPNLVPPGSKSDTPKSPSKPAGQ